MTAQATDTFLFKRKSYQLIGITGGDLFSSQDFGINADFESSGCWRGFYSTYEIIDKVIYLKEMTVLLAPRKDGDYKTINNVLPQQISNSSALYKNVNLPVSSFTGKLRIARGFIDELYVHMGFPKPSAFKTVFDLTFEGGQLKKKKDRSREMKKKRGAFKKLYNKHCKNGKIGQAVVEAFSLDMENGSKPMQTKPAGIVKDKKIICPTCKVKYNIPTNSKINYPINIKCKKCFVSFIVYDPETIGTVDSSENCFQQQKQKVIKKSPVNKFDHKEQKIKFKTAKSNLIISIIIAALYGLALILLPLYAIDIMVKLLTILILSSLASWIVWRLSGRKDKGGSMTFKIVLIIILLVQFAQYGINAYEKDNRNKTSLSKTIQKDTMQTNNLNNSNPTRNVDELNNEEIAKKLELYVFDHIKKLGHQVKNVKFITFYSFGPDYSVFILSYKTNDFEGVYFLSPEAKRYVIYDTDDDMKKFNSMYEMNEEELKNIIRIDFKKFAGFELPNE